MNALLCKPCVTTDAELDIYDVPGSQEDFATAAMQAIQPENAATDEEELHLSFEEAISDRILALGINRSYTGAVFATTGPLQDISVKHALSTLASLEPEPYANEQASGRRWLRHATYACMALMFILIGFDLMGLLILHLR